MTDDQIDSLIKRLRQADQRWFAYHYGGHLQAHLEGQKVVIDSYVPGHLKDDGV